MNSYYLKYLKYKEKYLVLKNTKDLELLKNKEKYLVLKNTKDLELLKNKEKYLGLKNTKDLELLKNKEKYLKNQNQIGGALASMPQLCFGTHNPDYYECNLEECLNKALKIGYRHIDGAQEYIEKCSPNYLKIIRDALKKYPRNEIWITWKSASADINEIQRIIAELDCEYIDLFLIHYGCGKDEDFCYFKQAQKQNLIRYYGVSNCRDLVNLAKLKKEHDIFANQIQAIQYKNDLIFECNKLGISVMLFSAVSGLHNAILDSNNFEYFDHKHLINKYYLNKYILPSKLSITKNVMMNSSVSCNSIQPNFDEFNQIVTYEEPIPDKELQIIRELLKIVPGNMGV